MAVYFVQSGEDGLIKIGYSDRLLTRLKALQNAVEVEGNLTVLGIMDGGPALERELHERFAEHRESGEWFRPHQSIAEFCRDNCDPHLTSHTLTKDANNRPDSIIAAKLRVGIADALKYAPARSLVCATRSSIRTVKSWKSGQNAPSSAQLILLMGAFPAVAELVINMAGISQSKISQHQRDAAVSALKALLEE